MRLDFQAGSRTKILAILVLVIMAVFIVRLFYLQIIEHDKYVALANNEQLKRLTIPATRGEIYAMDDGTPVKLVLNETVYTVFADPHVTTNDGKIIDTIRRVAGGNAQPNLDQLLKDKTSRYQILAKGVSLQQAEMIKKESLSGVGFQAQSQRVYPEGQLASQVLGFVNTDGVGQYGVEQALNDQLKGKDGLLQSVTDVNDVPLTIGNKNINKPAVNGSNIVLSIDRNVQSYTEQALVAGLKRTGATNGSAIVMDPQTGRVLAMANLPSYDPTNYGNVQDPSEFLNDTISVPYEAGSVIKSLTVATGIDKGVITPTSTYNNTGTIRVDDITIQNASLTEVLGTQTMQTALTWSLNTGMVTVAERLGDGSNITKQARQTIYQYFHDKFGFGQLTGIELSGESPGDIISPDDEQGNAVRYSNMVFGQGMDVTMLQAASAFGSVIDGGIYRDPSVIAGTVRDDGTFVPNSPRPTRQVIQKSTSDQVRQMLLKDRHDNGGADISGYSVGGKTGTSQALINGSYSFNQTTGSYLGFGGDDTPRYVIMVQVSGKNMALGGAKDAGPIFTDISNWMLGYLRLAPKA